MNTAFSVIKLLFNIGTVPMQSTSGAAPDIRPLCSGYKALISGVIFRNTSRWSLQRSRTTSLRGDSPVEPWRRPGQSSCHNNPQYTRHPAWCLFAYLACRSQMAFSCACTRNFLPVVPTGLWTLVARASEAPVVPLGITGMPQTTKEG